MTFASGEGGEGKIDQAPPSLRKRVGQEKVKEKKKLDITNGSEPRKQGMVSASLIRP